MKPDHFSLCAVNIIQHKLICREGKKSSHELENKTNLSLGVLGCVYPFRQGHEKNINRYRSCPDRWWKMGSRERKREITLSFVHTLLPPLQLPGSSCSIVQNVGYTHRKWALSFLPPSYCCRAQREQERGICVDLEGRDNTQCCLQVTRKELLETFALDPTHTVCEGCTSNIKRTQMG